jgi:hypothetical protein
MKKREWNRKLYCKWWSWLNTVHFLAFNTICIFIFVVWIEQQRTLNCPWSCSTYNNLHSILCPFNKIEILELCTVEVLRGQPIKLLQVSTSEFHEYSGNSELETTWISWLGWSLRALKTKNVSSVYLNVPSRCGFNRKSVSCTFAILSPSRQEKRCQISERLFVGFFAWFFKIWGTLWIDKFWWVYYFRMGFVAN